MMDLSNRKVLAQVEHVWVTNSRTYLSEVLALSKQQVHDMEQVGI